MADALSTVATGASLAFPEAAPLIGAGIGLAQTIGGLFGENSAKKKLQNLVNQRQAYQTPKEIYQILNATESNASSGYDPFTLDYLTNQTDNAFTDTINAAERLGGDPNDLSAIFDKKVQAMMKIGADNHALNMENFGKFLSAKEMVASNLAAEQKSKEDILKDKISAATGNVNTARQDVGNGLNTFMGGLADYSTGQLYADRTRKMGQPVINNTVNSGFTYNTDGTITGRNAVTNIEDNRPPNYAWQ